MDALSSRSNADHVGRGDAERSEPYFDELVGGSQREGGIERSDFSACRTGRLVPLKLVKATIEVV